MVALFAAIALSLSAAPARIAITHVSVINVLNGSVRRDVTVLLSDDTILAIGKHIPTNNATVVDGSGKFLIPGLWDMHVHCCNADDHFFPLFLANGVTGIRDMADPLDELKTCRSNVEAGVVLGPRMVFSGQIVDGPKPIWPDISIAVATPEEARRAVETMQKGGADFVKVYSLLPRDAYFALADEAKKTHMVFAGHVPDLVSAAEASEAGQKSFEHLINVLEGCSTNETELLAKHSFIPKAGHIHNLLDSFDANKATALFARFRQNRTWQCPTLTVLNNLVRRDAPPYENDPRLAYLSSDIVALWHPTNSSRLEGITRDDWAAGRLLFTKCCQVVGTMHKTGVGLLAGTDTPNAGAFPGFGVHEELALFVQCGLTPLQALQTATLNPARYFGREKTMGTVQVGKVADLVLLNANPLQDISNTTNIAGVFVRGKYLDRAALERMLVRKSEG
jgi:imidazolonepropionase-like amidohydrolase